MSCLLRLCGQVGLKRAPILSSRASLKSRSFSSSFFPSQVASVSKLPRASSAPSTTRALRRSNNQSTTRFSESDLLPCTTMSTCDRYDLAMVIELLHQQGYKDASFLIPGEAVHVSFPNFEHHHGDLERSNFDVMVLVNGSIVGWGFEESFLQRDFAKLIEPAEIAKYNEIETEDMDYVTLASEHSTVEGDVMVVGGLSERQRLLDKAAFLFGLSRSTKLAVLESQFDQFVTKSRRATLEFYEGGGGSRGAKHKQTLQQIGELLKIRGDLNLYSELIETPDLYWSEPSLETLYRKILKTLDTAPRIEILNKKLDYATEELRIILATLNEEKALKLEMIIIYLIMIEVGFELFHFWEHYTERRNDSKLA